MKILGIDPGMGRTGWGVIEVEGSRIEAKSYGCIETFKDQTLEKRLLSLHDQLLEIISTEKPQEIAVEELFFANNAKTALMVGQARGIVLYLAAKTNLKLSEYTPLQVKLAVAGYGKAEKSQVEKMMMNILKLTQKPKRDDASDALSVALTHAFSRKMQSLGQK